MKALLFLIITFLTKIYSSKITPYIWGGQLATEGQFPHQAALRYKNSSSIYGSGVIISQRWILTCRLCIPDMIILDVEVCVGSVEPSKFTCYDIGVAIKHPWSSPTEFLHSDLGLIKVRRDIAFDWKTQPIEIETSIIPGDVQILVSAWGLSEFGPSTHLMWTYMSTLSKNNCEKIYPLAIYRTDLCAISTGKTVCDGDGGSGVINKEGKLIGTVSRIGDPCGKNVPESVHLRISAFHQWIKKEAELK